MKNKKILTISLMIIIILIIGILLFRFLYKNKENNENINRKYYLVATQTEINDKIEFLDIVPFELTYDNNYMTFCSEVPKECTSVEYKKNDNAYEIEPWGDGTLSGTFFIVEQTKNALVIEKYIDGNNKIINYFEAKK